MTRESREITVAIHTYEHALRLKNTLEREGIMTTLQNVNLQSPQISAGVRVRIPESELPKALRVIENPDIFRQVDEKVAGTSVPLIIVPVDFSVNCHNAVASAFALAASHKSRLLLIHAYMTPVANCPVPLSQDLEFNTICDLDTEFKTNNYIKKIMNRYACKLRDDIKHGKLPTVTFDTEIREGLPEEVIAEQAKERHPRLIVMGTRGAGNKEPRVMGSVAAEVLDTCRFPVFTIPHASGIIPVDGFEHALFFTSPDQQDIVAIDTFMRILSYKLKRMTFVSIPGVTSKSELGDNRQDKALVEYCCKHYGGTQFESHVVDKSNIDSDLMSISNDSSIDLLGVPNKKKNLLARFFNPTLAHKLLFLTDYPMIVIPV